MSIEAMSWVLKLDISRSSEKFIMVCMANYADERGVCFPSIATLARDTSQDRKTIIANLKRLSETGLLRDTGHRVGPTKSVPVYQLVGMPSASAVHYTYKTTNPETGEFYIGMRSFNGDPELDTYRGSSRWVVDLIGRGVPLHREVLEWFDNPVEAKAAELRLFRELGAHDLCRNEHAPHGASRELKAAHWARGAENGTASSGAKNGTPSSSTVFPSSSTVFPPKQSQKRDTEPPVNPSDKPPVNPIPANPPNPPEKKSRKRKDPPAAPVVVLPDWLPESTWNSWVEHRVALKAPLTDRAAELCIKRLAEMRAEGHDPIEAIDQSVRGGKWTDIYAPRPKPQQQQQQQGGHASSGYKPFNPMNSGAFDDLAQTGTQPARNYGNAVHGDGDIIDVDARSVDAQA
jgi:hypothetical protein